MKWISIVFSITILVVLGTSCQKSTEETPSEDMNDPVMSEEDVDVLDTINTIPLPDSLILLPGGFTAREYLLEYDPDFYYNWENQPEKQRSD